MTLEPDDSTIATVAATSFVLGSDTWSNGVTTTVTAIGSGHARIAIEATGLATSHVAVDIDP